MQARWQLRQFRAAGSSGAVGRTDVTAPGPITTYNLEIAVQHSYFAAASWFTTGRERAR